MNELKQFKKDMNTLEKAFKSVNNEIISERLGELINELEWIYDDYETCLENGIDYDYFEFMR